MASIALHTMAGEGARVRERESEGENARVRGGRAGERGRGRARRAASCGNSWQRAVFVVDASMAKSDNGGVLSARLWCSLLVGLECRVPLQDKGEVLSVRRVCACVWPNRTKG